ncbi:MAG: hypothetical protein U0165_08910 [Polyangiaceae bacterium]
MSFEVSEQPAAAPIAENAQRRLVTRAVCGSSSPAVKMIIASSPARPGFGVYHPGRSTFAGSIASMSMTLPSTFRLAPPPPSSRVFPLNAARPTSMFSGSTTSAVASAS